MSDRERVDRLRERVAEIDREILRALERRAQAVEELGAQRSGARAGPPLATPHVAALERAASPPLPAGAIRPVFQAIDEACRALESPARVVYVGPEGSIGWIAARGFFGAGAELLRADTVVAALEEVARSRVDAGIVPYESLKEGPMFPTILAITGRDLNLIGEHEVAVPLSLLSRSAEAETVEKVYVTPADHLECVAYLESHHPRAEIVDVRSPVVAIELAAEEAGGAAIVPEAYLGPHPLRIVRKNIADSGEQRLRYGVVGKLPAPRSGNDATALVFSVRDQPGALHGILQFFKDHGCNLRRIQSRPLAGEGWEYLFYVEVSGHVTDRPLVTALEGVKRAARTMKLVGSFPLSGQAR